MRRLVLVLAVIAGCTEPGVTPPMDDAGPIDSPPDQVVLPGLFGEACKFEPYPVNTTCHDDVGWCIEGTCRPMCLATSPRCPEGHMIFAPAGACYCAP